VIFCHLEGAAAPWMVGATIARAKMALAPITKRGNCRRSDVRITAVLEVIFACCTGQNALGKQKIPKNAGKQPYSVWKRAPMKAVVRT